MKKTKKPNILAELTDPKEGFIDAVSVLGNFGLIRKDVLDMLEVVTPLVDRKVLRQALSISLRIEKEVEGNTLPEEFIGAFEHLVAEGVFMESLDTEAGVLTVGIVPLHLMYLALLFQLDLHTKELTAGVPEKDKLAVLSAQSHHFVKAFVPTYPFAI